MMPKTDTSKERQRRYRAGRWAEALAAFALRLKGYRVLARRYRVASGEIDLVVKRRHHLAFVEVKKRKSVADAEAAVSARQRQRVRDAADIWLSKHPPTEEQSISFDIVFVVPRRWPRHMIGAL